MSGIGAAIIGGSIGTGLLTAGAQSSAAQNAANAQLLANQQAQNTEQQNYQQSLGYQNNALAQGNALASTQQGQLSSLFAPYTQAGSQALGGLNNYAQGGQQAFQSQQALSGALGNAAQTQAISGLQNSPMYQQLFAQGNQAILQNASATGGLRGGNTQASLAQFGPQLLNQLLQQQFTNLGSLSSLGQQSSSTLAGLGQSSASNQAQGGINILGQQLGLQGQVAGNVANLGAANTAALTGLANQQGGINAANDLAQGQAQAGLFGGIGNAINLTSLLGARGLLGTNSGGSSNLGGFGGATSGLGSGGFSGAVTQ